MDPAWSELQGNVAFLHKITGVSKFKPVTLTLLSKTKKLHALGFSYVTSWKSVA